MAQSNNNSSLVENPSSLESIFLGTPNISSGNKEKGYQVSTNMERTNEKDVRTTDDSNRNYNNNNDNDNNNNSDSIPERIGSETSDINDDNQTIPTKASYLSEFKDRLVQIEAEQVIPSTLYLVIYLYISFILTLIIWV